MENLPRTGYLCPLSMTILLSLLLASTSLLTPTPPAPATPERRAHVQLQFDPQRMALRWPCEAKANKENLTCKMEHPQKGPMIVTSKPPFCNCTFQPWPLHGGARFTLNGILQGVPVQETLLYTNPGAVGSAAWNFSCVIYAAEFMNCTWAKGLTAPEDVQYFLYLSDVKKLWELHCPNYLHASRTHVGCHLHLLDLSGLTPMIYFLVNGSSSRAEIPFFDTLLSLRKIEVYEPPRNISVQCHDAHCLVRWQKPRTRRPLRDQEFQYQLRLLRMSEPTRDTRIDIPGSEENQYVLPRAETRGQLSMQMRSASSRLKHGDPWGAWSQPLHVGYEELEPSLVHVYVLVVLGTLVCASVLLVVCLRFLRKCRLFPHIPHVRDKLNDGQQVEQQVSCEKCLDVTGKTESEHVLVVTLQETVPTPAGGGGSPQPQCPGGCRSAGSSLA